MLSEELRILNDRLSSTEDSLRQAQVELEKVENANAVKIEDTEMTDVVPSVVTADTVPSATFSVSNKRKKYIVYINVYI